MLAEGAGTRTRGRSSSTVGAVFGSDGFSSLMPAWRHLEQDVRPCGFYQQYLWMEGYVRFLADEPERIAFLTIGEGERARGILPLQLAGGARSWGRRTATLPDHPHLPITDGLFDSRLDAEATVEQLIGGVDEHFGRYAWIDLPRIPEGSFLDAGISRIRSVPVLRQSAGASNWLPCDEGYEGLQKRLSGHFRRNLRRLGQRVEALGAVTYRAVCDPSQMQDAFDSFLEIEGSGWKGKEGEGTAIQCHADLLGFYRHLALAGSASGKCVINLLELDGRPIAAQFCLFSNGVLNLLKIGYSEELKHVSPGFVLLDRVLRDWGERDDVHAVSLVTDTAWQSIWRPVSSPLVHARIYNRSWVGAADRLWRRARPRVKHAVKSAATAVKRAGNTR